MTNGRISRSCHADAIYHRARIRAAEAGRSVSALVRVFLNGLGTAETETERLTREAAVL